MGFFCRLYFRNRLSNVHNYNDLSCLEICYGMFLKCDLLLHVSSCSIFDTQLIVKLTDSISLGEVTLQSVLV